MPNRDCTSINVRRLDAVVLLGFSRDSIKAGAKFVDQLIHDGKLRAVHYGRRVFVRREDVERIAMNGVEV